MFVVNHFIEIDRARLLVQDIHVERVTVMFLMYNRARKPLNKLSPALFLFLC